MHNRKGPKQKAPIGCLWIEDAAPYIGVTLSTLRKWRLKNKCPGQKGFLIGRFVAFKISDLDAYLDGQYQTAVAPDAEQKSELRPPEPLIPRKQVRAVA